MREPTVNPLPKPLKILLIGDSCYDEYHYGNINRISPEAPVPVLDKDSTIVKKGMAYNVFNNLVNLGAVVHIITEFMEIKHRYLDAKTGQQLLRVDEKIKNRKLIDTADDNLDDYDAVVISDYNKGFFKYEDIKRIRNAYTGPIFVDTKKNNLYKFRGCFVKINQYEYENRATDTEQLIVTYGSNGVKYKGKEYSAPKVEAYDVCGAGDTFLAALAYKYCEDYNIDEAIRFAIRAASITVQKIGVYAPTLNEVLNET